MDPLVRLALDGVRAYRANPLDAETVELMADLEFQAIQFLKTRTSRRAKRRRA